MIWITITKNLQLKIYNSDKVQVIGEYKNLTNF